MSGPNFRTPVIACDLDGTLAYYDEWKGIEHIGFPIPGTLRRVKEALARGWEVVIFTARVAEDGWRKNDEEIADVRRHIEAWCEKHVGQRLAVTANKSGRFTEIWDDRAVSFMKNEGIGCAINESHWGWLAL